jgi:DNA-binding transcriptional LysR family regulator
MMDRRNATITLAQLQGLVAVVDGGSFTAAARALGISQSSVSQTVGALEEELDLILLRRGRDGVTLTEACERLLVHARGVLEHLEHMRQEAAALAGLTVGKLRLAAFSSVFTRLLPGIVGSFSRRYPGIDLVLLEGADPDVRNWLGAGVADIGLLTLPADGVETVPLIDDTLQVVVSAGHTLANVAVVRPEQLAGEHFIMPAGGCESLVQSSLRAAGVELHSQFEVRDMTTIFALVHDGIGITMVPALALPAQIAGLQVIPLDPPAPRQIGLAMRSLAALPPAGLAFLAHAREWVATHQGH